MLKSLASTVGFMPLADVDPWDWTVEEVVTALCSPSGELRTLEPDCYPEPIALAQAIREHHLRGKGLIRHDVDRAFLRDYLGIKAAGWQNAVLDTITQLRTRSPKFRDTIQMEASSFAVPSHSVRSRFGSIQLPHNARFGGYASPIDAPLARYLMEPLQMQQVHESPKAESPKAHVLTLDDHPELPQTPLKIAVDEADDHMPQEALVDSEPATLHSLKHLSPSSECDARDTTNVIGSTLRAGEIHVVDATGRKRRRLNLSGVSTEADPGLEEVCQLALPGGLDNAASDVQHRPNEMPTYIEDKAHAENDLQLLAGASSSPLLTPHATENYFAADMLSEPGQLVVDAEGRKRMRPILVQEPSDVITQPSPSMLQQSAHTDEKISSVKVGALDIVGPNEIKATSLQALGRRKMGSNRTYLGPKALPVDEFFYGNTKIEEEVRHPDQYENLVSIKGLVEDTENWMYLSDDVYGAGLRISLNNRMKYRLLNNHLLKFQRGKERLFGLVPYPSRISKRRQPPSMTLISSSASGISIRRVRRSAWLKADPISGTKPQATYERSHATESFDVPEDESLSAQLGENETQDWDFLEKWRFVETEQNILPLYGESGSEGELDYDTWREIEKEETVEVDRPLGPSKNRHLTTSIVSDTIESSIAQIVEDWKSKKLPNIESKAWWLWTKSRRDKSKRDQIVSISAHIEKLETRLEKLVKELKSEIWSSTHQLKKQCRCLEETIYDRESSTWKVGILELRSPPSKPIKADRTLAIKKPKSIPESLQEGEEELMSEDSIAESSEDEFDGFIVGDDVRTDVGHSAPDGVSPIINFDAEQPDIFVPGTELADEGPRKISPIDASGNESEDHVVNTPVGKVNQLAQQSMPDRGTLEERSFARPALLPDSSEVQVHEFVAAGDEYEPEYEPTLPVVDEYEPKCEPTLPVVDGYEPEYEPEQPNDDDYQPQDKPELHDSDRGEVNELVIGDDEYEPALPDNTNGLSGSVIHTSVKRNSTPSNFIDLTLLSDSVDPLSSPPSPQLKLEDHRIRTPEKKERDPFERARRSKPAFKPPFPSHIVDLGSDEPKSQGKDFFTSTKPAMPEMWEVDKIGRLSRKYLEERQDRKRLLTWIFMHTDFERRKGVVTATHDTGSALMQLNVWHAMELLMKDVLKIRSTSIKNPEAVMQIAIWYVSWHMCKVFDQNDGIPVSSIKSARSTEGERGFEEFYKFIVEQLNLIGLRDEKSSQFFKSSPSNNQHQSKKRQQKLDGDLESDDTMGLTQRKKRKRPVPESQEALELRQSARERAYERDRRQEHLHRHLSKMGAASGDPSTMIVNGKSGDDMIVVNAHIGQRLQPHQLEGIQFMWGEIVTGGEAAQGCLLAHTMGLGKTMQVITLLVTIMEASNHSDARIRDQIPVSLQTSRTLVLCPPSLINNWYDEFLMWTPKILSEHIGQIRKVSSSLSPQQRIYEIKQWAESGGVLLLGYTTFKDLVLNKPKSKAGEQTRNLAEEEHEELCAILLEYPNIVIADEAHAMKRQANDVAKAVKQVKTGSRIALTGSPLSNNLEEYYSIVDWVAPNYLGGRAEFRDKYVEPINQGLYADASIFEKRKGLKMLQVLKAELAPKVLRADISVLKGLLKGKTEFVIRVPLTELQLGAYRLYADHMLNASKSKEPGSARLWAWLAILGLLCNHPQCFLNKLTEKGADNRKKQKKPKALSTRATNNVEDSATIEADAEALLEESTVKLGIPQSMVDEQVALFKKLSVPIESENLAYKMLVLFQILKFSAAAGDKTLVFSHSLNTLNYVEDQLKRKKTAYARLDGQTNMGSRQQLTKNFNSGNVNVCLISTKAGGQGLNLFGANRVVILDEHFNPMHEEQAIGRAYRIGQKKHVYVYRLTVGGTFEQALQDQSLFKLQLATRVVDKKNPQRHALKGARQYLFPPKVLEQKDLTAFEGKDSAVLDKILASQESPLVIRSIDLSETFHQEVEEPLTAEERQETEQMVKDEQLRRTDPKAYEKIREQRLADHAREQMLLLSQRLPTNGPSLPSIAHATTGLPTYNPLRDAMAESTAGSNYMPSLMAHQTMTFEQTESTAVATGPPPTRTQPQALSAAHTLSPTPNINCNVPSIEPILGVNTRVGEHVASISPEKEGSMIQPQHSLPQLQVVSAEFEQRPVLSHSDKAAELNTRSAVTPSSASRTDSEPLTDGLPYTNYGLREVARKEVVASIAPVVTEHVAKGTFDPWVGKHVSEALASSIVRHAERTTTNDIEYWQSVHAAVRNVLARGDASDALVLEANRQVYLKHSKRLEAIASSTFPSEGSHSHDRDQNRPLAENDGVDRALSPTSAKEGGSSPKKRDPDECVIM